MVTMERYIALCHPMQVDLVVVVGGADGGGGGGDGGVVVIVDREMVYRRLPSYAGKACRWW